MRAPLTLRLGGRRLRVSPVFDTYWRLAAERQAIFFRRLEGGAPPWTDDQILQRHKFTNAYRASDRVSQYLIAEVIYRGSQEPTEVVFRTLLFKFFNRIETWELLLEAFGQPTWSAFDFDRYDQLLMGALIRGEPIYSAAYIIPSPRFGCPRKHQNHQRAVEVLRDGIRRRWSRCQRWATQVLPERPCHG